MRTSGKPGWIAKEDVDMIVWPRMTQSLSIVLERVFNLQLSEETCMHNPAPCAGEQAVASLSFSCSDFTGTLAMVLRDDEQQHIFAYLLKRFDSMAYDSKPLLFSEVLNICAGNFLTELNRQDSIYQLSAPHTVIDNTPAAFGAAWKTSAGFHLKYAFCIKKTS